MLRNTLNGKGLRVTHVRKAILRGTLECQGHFDAFTLAAHLRRSGRMISVSTVYRNIPLMVDARILRLTPLSRVNSQVYEVAFERPAHYHLTCQSCGTIVEFHVEAFAALRKNIARAHSFELTSYMHELVGICAKCTLRKRR